MFMFMDICMKVNMNIYISIHYMYDTCFSFDFGNPSVMYSLLGDKTTPLGVSQLHQEHVTLLRPSSEQ